METSLADAFALEGLARVQEFHLSPSHTSAPVRSSWSLPASVRPTEAEAGPLPLFHALPFERGGACFKHSDLFKVKGSRPKAGIQLRTPAQMPRRATTDGKTLADTRDHLGETPPAPLDHNPFRGMA